MVRALVKAAKKTEEGGTVPDILIREEIDGKPYYYKGYKEVLNKEKKLEDIMGASGLQAFIVEILLRFLMLHLARKKYRIFSNEVGGHIRKGTNLSFDIAVFDKKVLPFEKINEYYTTVPPKMVLEIDVKIELEDEDALDYINTKTETLFEYGTDMVLWVLTKQKKLIVAKPGIAWQFTNWSDDVELLDGVVLNLAALMKEEEEMG